MKALTKLLKPGERLCNCKRAFAIQTTGLVFKGEGIGYQPGPVWTCPYGCSAAQMAAADRLAEALNGTGG